MTIAPAIGRTTSDAEPFPTVPASEQARFLPHDVEESVGLEDAHRQAAQSAVPRMTHDTRSASDWADRYLRYKLDETDDAAVDPVVPPESAAFVDDLSYIELSNLPTENRSDHLETAVYALPFALAGEEAVAERNLHGRSAAAYRDDDRIVVVVDGLGEVISVDRTSAALLTFAYLLRPREFDDVECDDRKTAALLAFAY